MLKRGDVFILRAVRFGQNEPVDKIIIILARPNADSLLFGVTTSQSHAVYTPRGRLGCQAGLDFYFFPSTQIVMEGARKFDKDSWFKFDTLYLKKEDEILNKLTTDQGNQIGRLLKDNYFAVLNCAIKSDSLPGKVVHQLRTATKDKSY